ncbi:helix-turn-helix domain-containing protein [Methylobacter sp. BlB1]|uniref:helix-turn-helix domain-containing protein n=1 Tax=Methylobacter sp. BlB1 TaxID=2785914 RepID=UPI0018946A2B|nr:helix-turn-helix domain-containing protein [Methylobacter sp. BlB1]MBF6650947.1 helix-turn-helix domain-containing protein [Methylobacter sp. BlB1]
MTRLKGHRARLRVNSKQAAMLWQCIDIRRVSFNYMLDKWQHMNEARKEGNPQSQPSASSTDKLFNEERSHRDIRSCMKRLFLLAMMAVVQAGCGEIYLDAPRGSNINLMAEKKPAQVKVEQVVWFKYWGNEPFSEPETHAATIIHDKHLNEARILMLNTVADGIISTFTSPFGFIRRTLIVEGNPGPEGNAQQVEPQGDTVGK